MARYGDLLRSTKPSILLRQHAQQESQANAARQQKLALQVRRLYVYQCIREHRYGWRPMLFAALKVTRLSALAVVGRTKWGRPVCYLDQLAMAPVRLYRFKFAKASAIS